MVIGAFMRRAVAGAINQAQYLAGIGERQHQRVIPQGLTHY